MFREVSLLLLHIIGIAVLYKPYKHYTKRKFFCILDKITIGNATPQCIAGIIAHTIGLALSLLQVGGYGFYPISMWTFIVLITSLYTYKSMKELCRECVLTFFISSTTLILTISLLSYTPYIALFTYLIIFTLALCFTAFSA